MSAPDTNEEELLKSVALQTATSIAAARRRAEHELLQAKEALEDKTAELARSLAMMSATFESTTDSILVTDEHGNVSAFNKKFVEMWRLPATLTKTGQHAKVLDITERQFANPSEFRERIRNIYAASPPESFDVLETIDGRVI